MWTSQLLPISTSLRRWPGALRVEAMEAIPVGPIVRLLEDGSATVTETGRQRPSLEDVFVEVTGIDAHDMAAANGGGGAR